MRVLRRAALALAACALLGACKSGGGGGGGGAGDGGTDTAPSNEIVPLFNVFPEAANVWPGGLADVKVFFQGPPPGTWQVTLGPVTGDAQVTLAGDTLTAATPETWVHVETAATATGMVSFKVTATNGSRRVDGLAEIGLYRADAATMPGYQITLAGIAPPDPAKARFKTRVVGYGGFEGRVHLVAAASEGHGELTFGAPSLMVTGTTPAETTIEAERRASGPAQLSLWGVWRSHVETANATEGAAPAARPTFTAEVTRNLVVTAPDSQLLRYGLWPMEGSGAVPTIELVGAAPGFTIASGSLKVDATATPGPVDLPVLVRSDTSTAPATLHVSVVPKPRAGWELVGNAIAGRDCGGAALSAVAGETVTFGAAARCRLLNGQWMRLGDDGSAVSTFTRSSVRYEARQAKDGTISLNVVDLSPTSVGTRFWNVDEKGNRVNAPTAAVDDSGQWWLAFIDANGRPRVFRHGTTAAGVLVVDGLPPQTGSRPAISANGTQVYLALTAVDGAVSVYSLARNAPTLKWALVAGLDAKIADQPVALDVDAQQRPVIVWASADGQVHAARYAGAWDPLGTFAPHEGGLAYDLSVVADRAGEPLIGWRAAAHLVMRFDAYPAPTSATAIELRRGTAAAKLEPTDPRVPITAFAMAIDDANTPVVVTVEGPVTQVVRWTGP